MKNKIGIITNSFPRYETDYSGKFVISALTNVLGKYEIHIIYPSNMIQPQLTDETFTRHQLKYPFKVYPMSQVSGLDTLNAIRLSYDLYKSARNLINSKNIQLVHAYWAIPAGFIGALTKGKIPFILTIPGSDIKIFAKNPLFRQFIKFALSKADIVIVRSGELKNEVIQLGTTAEKVVILPAGVDTKAFKPLVKNSIRQKLNLPNDRLLIFIGTLTANKRVDSLVAICAHLAQKHNCHLIIVGDGPERNHVQETARRLNYDKVIFTGKIPNEEVALYLAASDILLLGSKSEGMPNCVQEAMACGTPVISTNVGGVPDIITNDVTGYIVNDFVEMENSIDRLIDATGFLKEMGDKARQFALTNLSIDIIAKKMETIYESILSRHKSY